jgi:hypothetical protein
MQRINSFTRNLAIAALVLSGIAASQARAATALFTFSNPLSTPTNNPGVTHTYTSQTGGLSLTASGYSCTGLCASSPNADFSSSTTALYDNSDGLGLANNYVSSTNRYEIPNTKFVQLDFSSIFAGNTVTSIQFVMTDIVTSWSLYDSKTKGVLQGAGGVQLQADNKTTATFTINNPSSALYLYDVVAGTNCDVVLNSVTVTYSNSTVQATPEPATFLVTGLALVGIAGIIKKARKKA